MTTSWAERSIPWENGCKREHERVPQPLENNGDEWA